jgi:MFS family permease
MLNKPEKLLLYGGNIWYLGEGMLGPLFAVFAERVGGDILDISWAWATYMIVTGVFMLIFGALADKWRDTARMMVAGYALNALCIFGYLLVTSPLQLLLVQVGLGIATAMATPTWNALYSRFEDKKHDGLTWGLAGGEAHVVVGIGMLVGGALAAYVSFDALFVVMGVIQTIATIYQARILKFAR